MANDYYLQTIDPKNPTGPMIEAVITGDYYLRLYKYYPIGYENLRAAKYVLEKPLRIFSGVREFNEGYWCYVGRPHEWYIRENRQEAFPDELVFAVYLNSNMRIYECRAEPCADDDKDSPKDWRNRYGGLVWKSIS